MSHPTALATCITPQGAGQAGQRVCVCVCVSPQNLSMGYTAYISAAP